jgi:hypothetical protein
MMVLFGRRVTRTEDRRCFGVPEYREAFLDLGGCGGLFNSPMASRNVVVTILKGKNKKTSLV